MVPSPSGWAELCKSSHSGSNPLGTSHTVLKNHCFKKLLKIWQQRLTFALAQ